MSKKNYVENLVSIICLGYKHVNFIKENIFALWKNKYTQIEIIAIDDGSNDGSDILLHELAKQSPCPMTVIVQKNTGNIPKNFNIGLKAAKGEYVSMIAFDDLIAADAISSKIEVMKKNKKILFIFNDEITSIDEKSTIMEKSSPFRVLEMKEISASSLLEQEYLKFGSFFIQGALFRHDAIDAVNGFDEDLLGDDIILRCKLFKYLLNNPHLTFRVFPQSACYYRNHSNNIHKNTIRQIKLASEVLERFFPEKSPPKILFVWIHSALSYCSFEDALIMFSHNRTLSNLLKEAVIHDMLKANALRSALSK